MPTTGAPTLCDGKTRACNGRCVSKSANTAAEHNRGASSDVRNWVHEGVHHRPGSGGDAKRRGATKDQWHPVTREPGSETTVHRADKLCLCPTRTRERALVRPPPPGGGTGVSMPDATACAQDVHLGRPPQESHAGEPRSPGPARGPRSAWCRICKTSTRRTDSPSQEAPGYPLFPRHRLRVVTHYHRRSWAPIALPPCRTEQFRSSIRMCW